MLLAQGMILYVAIIGVIGVTAVIGAVIEERLDKRGMWIWYLIVLMTFSVFLFVRVGQLFA